MEGIIITNGRQSPTKVSRTLQYQYVPTDCILFYIYSVLCTLKWIKSNMLCRHHHQNRKCKKISIDLTPVFHLMRIWCVCGSDACVCVLWEQRYMQRVNCSELGLGPSRVCQTRRSRPSAEKGPPPAAHADTHLHALVHTQQRPACSGSDLMVSAKHSSTNKWSE